MFIKRFFAKIQFRGTNKITHHRGFRRSWRSGSSNWGLTVPMRPSKIGKMGPALFIYFIYYQIICKNPVGYAFKKNSVLFSDRGLKIN